MVQFRGRYFGKDAGAAKHLENAREAVRLHQEYLLSRLHERADEVCSY